jgi:hypothetical protein
VAELTTVFGAGFWWLAPIVGFFGSLNLIATGILGEYVLLLRSKINKRPLVVEELRINFED